MSIRIATASLALSLLGVVSHVRAQDADPARLFPRELDVQTPGGVARLALPAEVLAAVRPDLSDVRLYDGDVEIPFLTDSGARPLPSWPDLPRQSVTPIGATRRASSAGTTETFILPPPPTPRPNTHWTLALDTPAQDFVRGLRVSATSGEGSVTTLVDTSVFRFAAPRRERVIVTLPQMPGSTSVLSVVLTGQPVGALLPGALAPTFSYVAVAGAVDAPRISVALDELARRREAGRTYVTLACPPGLRPDVLRVETTTPSFARDVRVEAGGTAVGGASLYRVDLPSLRDGAVLELGLTRFTGDRLEVAIDDGDSPPLAGLRFVASMRQPALVFGSAAGPVLMRFGGGRARAARYDLASLSGGEGERLLAAPDLAEASAGAARANPRFDPSPALAFLGRPGIRVDATKMTHVAAVTIRDAREGVARLRVPVTLGAVTRSDLGDLRIVGRDGRQFPYVLDAAGARVDLPVRVGTPSRVADETRYTLGLPVTRALVESLRIDVDATFTERPYIVRGRLDDGTETILSNDVLRRAPGETGPLVIALLGQRVHDVMLAVEDGDDAPLRIERVIAVTRCATLVVAAPPGSYRLLAGDASLASPVYEMTRAQPLIDAVPLAEASVARPTRNPAFREPGFFERAGAGALALWAALLFAVLLLGVVTLRVARATDEPAPQDAPAPEAVAADPAPSDRAPVEPVPPP